MREVNDQVKRDWEEIMRRDRGGGGGRREMGGGREYITVF